MLVIYSIIVFLCPPYSAILFLSQASYIPRATAITILDDTTPHHSLTFLTYNCSFSSKLLPRSNNLSRRFSRKLSTSSSSPAHLLCFSSLRYLLRIEQTFVSPSFTFSFLENSLVAAEIPCIIECFPIFALSFDYTCGFQTSM